MASTAKALLAIAAQQIGTREGWDPVNQWYNNIQKYGAWYAAQVHNLAFNGVAWCDEFVSWCGAMSGNGDTIPLSAYVPGRLAWARSKGLTGHYPPAPGDLGIVMEYEYGGSGQVIPHSRHIFIVERYLGDGRVQTIEGNTNDNGSAQGNGVYRLIRQDSADSNRYIYIRPQYAPEPAPVPPVSRDENRPPVFNLADIKMDMGKGVDLASLRPGKTNPHVARLESAIWNWRGPAFRRGLVSRYKLTSRAQLYSPTYGPMLSWMVGDSYRLLDQLEPAKAWITPDQRAGRKPLPTYPGPAFLRRIGFTHTY